MNWKLVGTLSLFGLAMGVATVFVIPSNIEPAFWLAIFIVCGFLIAKRAPGKHFLHGLCTSLVNSGWITGAHLAFFDTYVANHPQEAAMMQNMPIAGRLAMAVTGPVVGIVSGLILGLIAFVMSRFIKPAV